MTDMQLWSVTLTVAGDPVEPSELRAALDRLLLERPFISAIRYCADRAELRYWDEAETLDDAAALALRLWGEHRPSTGLPGWRPVGLEVLDRGTIEHRASQAAPATHAARRRERLPVPVSPVGNIAAW
ncbi:hypothetical protein CLV92_10862 [Kineococcus xinjiangensis]|uniref:Uncharacterized protein n=1 Tax=Kineococcus xinjiangensis TaxID=512762 RepID=A0A2S6IIW6_9ACTN|nr:hypothetical protein [Kineococcus xinjiangensis]PPK94163.1 hypothetical protein CLV92_10862 [Kineococcus xinjiangensis]